MDFKEYLHNKKIDAERFQKEEPALWARLETIFGQVHPKSFTAQKLYLINPIRRKYPAAPVVDKQGESPLVKQAIKPRAIVRPKPLSKEKGGDPKTVKPKIMRPKAKPVIKRPKND